MRKPWKRKEKMEEKEDRGWKRDFNE